MAASMSRAIIKKSISYRNICSKLYSPALSSSASIHLTQETYSRNHIAYGKSAAISRPDPPATDVVADSTGRLSPTEFENTEGDQQFRKLQKTLSSRDQRYKYGVTALQGLQTILTAYQRGVHIETLYYSGGKSTLENIPTSKLQQRGTRIYPQSFEKLQTCLASEVVEPLLGICRIPDEVELSALSEKDVDGSTPLILICDRIRDPGNMSTLIKAFQGTAGRHMILTKGCVDVWEPKVIRGAVCAQFGAQISTSVTWDRIRSALPSSASVLLADNLPQRHEDVRDLKSIPRGKVVSLPCENYTDIDYASNTVTVVVIGGETEGICKEAYDLCRDWNGRIANIPMLTGVESLNASMAASILLYEVLRQCRRIHV